MRKLRAVGLIVEPYARDENGRKEPGGVEGTTPVTTACPEAGKQKFEKKRENLKYEGCTTEIHLLFCESGTLVPTRTYFEYKS